MIYLIYIGYYQRDWLKKFICVWDKAQELERDIFNLRKDEQDE